MATDNGKSQHNSNNTCIDISNLTANITGWQFSQMPCLLSNIQEAIEHDIAVHYSTAKNQFANYYNDIKQQLAQRLHTNKPQNNQSNGVPKCIIVAGIPYSGKSTYIQTLITGQQTAINYAEQPPTIVISFDEIMLSLPLYQELSKQISPKFAFKHCELLARVIGYELLAQAINARRNIIFEHSSALAEHVALYQLINRHYDCTMQVLDIPLKLAHKRATIITATNAEHNETLNHSRQNRYTPLPYLDDRYQTLHDLLPTYKRILTVNIIAVTDKE